MKKPPRYRDFGVPEYWVVDARAQIVERYRLAHGTDLPEAMADIVRWQPDPAVAPLELRVASILEDL